MINNLVIKGQIFLWSVVVVLWKMFSQVKSFAKQTELVSVWWFSALALMKSIWNNNMSPDDLEFV